MDWYTRCQTADLDPILAKGWTGIEVRLGVDQCDMRLSFPDEADWNEDVSRFRIMGVV